MQWCSSPVGGSGEHSKQLVQTPEEDVGEAFCVCVVNFCSIVLQSGQLLAMLAERRPLIGPRCADFVMQ